MSFLKRRVPLHFEVAAFFGPQGTLKKSISWGDRA